MLLEHKILSNRQISIVCKQERLQFDDILKIHYGPDLKYTKQKEKKYIERNIVFNFMLSYTSREVEINFTPKKIRKYFVMGVGVFFLK